MLLSDFFNMLAMAVFACIGGVFLGMGFLLLKLAGIFFGWKRPESGFPI